MASELCGVCAEPIATGPDEPASGLCPTCEEMAAADRDRDDSLEQLLWPVRNRNEFEG